MLLIANAEVAAFFAFLVLTQALLSRALLAYLKADTRRDYEERPRPRWAPPPLVFGLVWPWLYVLLAASGAITRIHSAWSQAPLILYAALLAALLVWPAIYVGLKRRKAGIAVHLAALGLAIAYIAVVWELGGTGPRWAAILTIPLASWLAFALILSIQIERMARRFGTSGQGTPPSGPLLVRVDAPPPMHGSTHGVGHNAAQGAAHGSVHHGTSPNSAAQPPRLVAPPRKARTLNGFDLSIK